MAAKPTVVVQLVGLVFHRSMEGTSHSWTRLNTALAQVVLVAIRAGLRFRVDDFGQVHLQFRGSYWFGSPSGEKFYTAAVEVGNTSACLAFEEWRGRKAFKVEDKRVALGTSFHLGERPKKGGQVKRHTVTVTSFSDDGVYLTAVSHKWVNGKIGGEQKIDRRFKLDRAKLKDLARQM